MAFTSVRFISSAQNNTTKLKMRIVLETKDVQDAMKWIHLVPPFPISSSLLLDSCLCTVQQCHSKGIVQLAIHRSGCIGEYLSRIMGFKWSWWNNQYSFEWKLGTWSNIFLTRNTMICKNRPWCRTINLMQFYHFRLSIHSFIQNAKESIGIHWGYVIYRPTTRIIPAWVQTWK